MRERSRQPLFLQKTETVRGRGPVRGGTEGPALYTAPEHAIESREREPKTRLAPDERAGFSENRRFLLTMLPTDKNPARIFAMDHRTLVRIFGAAIALLGVILVVLGAITLPEHNGIFGTALILTVFLFVVAQIWRMK